MTDYEIIEHTSEIGFRAAGDTLADAFGAAGTALFHIMTDVNALDTEVHQQIHVTSENLEALLYDFVDDLIYLSQAESFLGRDFDLAITEEPDGYTVDGTIHGQYIGDGMRLQEVKAPTYSDMRVEQTGAGWVIEMVLDV